MNFAGDFLVDFFGPFSLEKAGGKKSTPKSTAKFKSEFGSFAAKIHTARIWPWLILPEVVTCNVNHQRIIITPINSSENCCRVIDYTLLLCTVIFKIITFLTQEHFKTVAVTVTSGKLIQMTFKTVIGNRWKWRGDCGRQDGNGNGNLINSSEFQDGNGNGNLGEINLEVQKLTRSGLNGVSERDVWKTNLPFSSLSKVLYLRGENCLQNAHSYKQNGPWLKAPLNWTGSVFPLLTTLRAKGTLISEPRFSTSCEMQFFPREKEETAFSKKNPRQWSFSLSRVGKTASRRG